MNKIYLVLTILISFNAAVCSSQNESNSEKATIEASSEQKPNTKALPQLEVNGIQLGMDIESVRKLCNPTLKTVTGKGKFKTFAIQFKAYIVRLVFLSTFPPQTTMLDTNQMEIFTDGDKVVRIKLEVPPLGFGNISIAESTWNTVLKLFSEIYGDPHEMPGLTYHPLHDEYGSITDYKGSPVFQYFQNAKWKRNSLLVTVERKGYDFWKGYQIIASHRVTIVAEISPEQLLSPEQARTDLK